MLAGSIAADEGRRPAEIDSKVWGMLSPRPLGQGPSRSRSPLGRHISLEPRSLERATPVDHRLEQRGQQLRFGIQTFLVAAGIPVMEVYAVMCELPNYLFCSWAHRHPQEPNSVLISDLGMCITHKAPRRWVRFRERAMHMERLVRQRSWAWQAAHALKRRLAAEGARLANYILGFIAVAVNPATPMPSKCRHCRIEFNSCAEVVRHVLSATAH